LVKSRGVGLFDPTIACSLSGQFEDSLATAKSIPTSYQAEQQSGTAPSSWATASARPILVSGPCA